MRWSCCGGHDAVVMVCPFGGPRSPKPVARRAQSAGRFCLTTSHKPHAPSRKPHAPSQKPQVTRHGCLPAWQAGTSTRQCTPGGASWPLLALQHSTRAPLLTWGCAINVRRVGIRGRFWRWVAPERAGNL
eukprot:365528-Chlamydomonas_euryale.AAC.3